MHEPAAVSTVSAPVRISPSQVETARQCPLRFVLYKSSPERSLPLPSSYASRYLGDAFHRVVEAARHGEAGNPPERAQLETIWRQFLAQAERAAIRNGDELWLPLEESQLNLERTRLWSIRMALKQRVRDGQRAGEGQTETWLESGDGLVAGRLDAIEIEGGALVIQDVKSGDVVDSSGAVKEEYATQMYLYAALHFECRGIWPDELRLVDRRGRVEQVRYTRDLASNAMASAKAFLRSVQESVGTDATVLDERIAQLAEPEGSACPSCRCRPICPLYRELLSAKGLRAHRESRYSLVDLVGTVQNVDLTDNDRVRLELRHNGEVRSIQNLTRHGRFRDSDGLGQPPALPVPGDYIAVFNAVPRRPLDTYPAGSHLVVSRSVRAYKMRSSSRRR